LNEKVEETQKAQQGLKTRWGDDLFSSISFWFGLVLVWFEMSSQNPNSDKPEAKQQQQQEASTQP
jgi:hypothetical protein